MACLCVTVHNDMRAHARAVAGQASSRVAAGTRRQRSCAGAAAPNNPTLNSVQQNPKPLTTCRHYRRPILLIEFDSSRAFAMNAASDITSEISNSSIISKLSLLCIHFPALRVLWSRDPDMTADMFHELKQVLHATPATKPQTSNIETLKSQQRNPEPLTLQPVTLKQLFDEPDEAAAVAVGACCIMLLAATALHKLLLQ